MEIFEALGLADRMLDEGVRTRAARFHSGGEVLGELDLGLAGCRYGFDLGVSEEVTERGPHRAPEGGRRIGHPLDAAVDLDQGPDGVTATLERDGEAETVAVDWVVGCDGLHSKVRELAGIEFPGSDIEAPWAVFDAAAAGWSEEHDVAAAFLDLPPVILTPLPGRRWRIYIRPTERRSGPRRGGDRRGRALRPGSRVRARSRTRRGSAATRASPSAIARAGSCSPATPPTPAPRPRATG